MKNWKLLAFVLSVFGLAVLAQTNTGGPTNIIGSTAPPSGSVDAMGLLLIVIPLGVPIIVAIGKFFIPKLPSWTLPIIAPSLGILIDYITARVTAGTFSPVTAALLGSAGVGIREIVDQMRQQMNNSTPPSATTTPPKP